jgi:hypothetical protein
MRIHPRPLAHVGGHSTRLPTARNHCGGNGGGGGGAKEQRALACAVSHTPAEKLRHPKVCVQHVDVEVTPSAS